MGRAARQPRPLTLSSSPSPRDAIVRPVTSVIAALSKRVAVIGAGPSGLATVKELLEEGHRPTCFERAPSLGGVFRFDEKDGVVWESCRLTSSILLTAFSDFPVPKRRTGHLTARRVRRVPDRLLRTRSASRLTCDSAREWKR